MLSTITHPLPCCIHPEARRLPSCRCCIICFATAHRKFRLHTRQSAEGSSYHITDKSFHSSNSWLLPAGHTSGFTSGFSHPSTLLPLIRPTTAARNSHAVRRKCWGLVVANPDNSNSKAAIPAKIQHITISMTANHWVYPTLPSGCLSLQWPLQGSTMGSTQSSL